MRAGWHGRSSEDLEPIHRLELPDEVVTSSSPGREPSDGLTYGVALYVIRN